MIKSCERSLFPLPGAPEWSAALNLLWLFNIAKTNSKSACGSFVEDVVWWQRHKPLHRQLIGLLGSFALVGPRALLFALDAGNFHQAVEALCISAGLTQNGSLLQRIGTDNAWVYVGAGEWTHDSHQSVLLSSGKMFTTFLKPQS